jgi:hypothetical protein
VQLALGAIGVMTACPACTHHAGWRRNEVVVRAPKHELLDWLTGRGTIDGAPPLAPW